MYYILYMYLDFIFKNCIYENQERLRNLLGIQLDVQNSSIIVQYI